MRGKALKAMRERHRKLMADDAANRCPVCKRAMVKGQMVATYAGKHFCTKACAEEFAYGAA